MQDTKPNTTPTLTLLCAVPAAGKSTYASKVKLDWSAIVISSDALRAMLGTSENDQSVSPQVFETMEAMAVYWLNKGVNVLIDATNTTMKARSRFVKLAKLCGASIHAVVFNVSLDEAKRRNAGRVRVVPEHVLERMHKQFETPQVGEVDTVEFVN